MSAPLDTDSSLSTELVDLRRQVFELQQALANAEHSRAPAHISTLGTAQVGAWEGGGRANRVITAPPLTDEQASESEALWRALYEHAGVGIAQLSLDGQFLRVNPR